MPKMNISVPGIAQPLAAYTAAVRAGHLEFAAGQVVSDFKRGVAAEILAASASTRTATRRSSPTWSRS